MNVSIKPGWHFHCIGGIFNHARRHYSGKCRYAERKTDNEISHITIDEVPLIHNKIMQYHELIVFCINSCIESEPNHKFIITTDNLTWTWFVACIIRRDTRLLIFWNKDIIVNFSCRNQTGMSICLTLEVTILASTT